MDDNTFRLYTSNKLDKLAELYLEHRKSNQTHFRKGGFFSKEKIFVATRGMGTWLEQWLVKNGQVIANVDFPFLRDAIDDILKRFMDTQPDKDDFHPELFQEEVLIWRIYRILDDDSLAADDMKTLKDYLATQYDDKARAVRRYQLAQKLAQLYYEYMAFVPEKLIEPKKNNISPANQWQITLWNKLCLNMDGTSILSPAHAMLRFLKNTTTLKIEDFEPVTFFGISAMAPYFLLVLKKLSSVCPVNFFYLNHCADLWDDAHSSWEQRKMSVSDDFDSHFNNTLLGNFGTLGREFFKAVLDLDGISDEEHFDYNHEWENQKTDASRNDGISLLKDIQTRILTNVNDSTQSPCPQEKDDSLTIHSCFNEIREVEALHDCLIKLINDDMARASKNNEKRMTMNDIIVMAPDIAKFAPTIQAVFDRGPLRSHYCISDRSVKGANHMAEAFLQVMEMPKSKFEVNLVSALLDSPPLKAKFGFDDSSIATLRKWFLKAGIHWGRNEEDRKNIGNFEEFSWQRGLDSLLAKLAFDENKDSNSPEEFFADIAPLDFSSGNENQTLLNGLFRFYENLKDFVNTVELSRTGSPFKTGPQWCDFLMEERTKFFQPDSESALDYSQLGKAFTAIKNAMILAGYKKDLPDGKSPETSDILPYEVILAAMSATMDSPAKGEPFLNGKITFCSLLPMRGIPCKNIALLGMDCTEFPRQNDNTGFTLVSTKDENGKEIKGSLLKYYDRSRSIEDRFTFLEALMSAQEHLMIFFNGQNDQNLKDDLVPAAPVAELINYIHTIRTPSIDSKDKTPKDWPIVKHRLNAFDPESFAKAQNTSLDTSKTLLDNFSFDKHMAQIAKTLSRNQENNAVKRPLWLDAFKLNVPTPLPNGWDKDDITITLDDLIKFFKDPATAFSVTRLGLPKNRWEDDPLSDFEPFNVNKLTASQIKNALTLEQTTAPNDEFSTDSNNSQVKKTFTQRGILPIGNAGNIAFTKLKLDSWIQDENFRGELRDQELSEEERFDVDLGFITPSLSEKLEEAIRKYAKNFSSTGNAEDIQFQTLPTKHVKITGRFKCFHEHQPDEKHESLRPQGVRAYVNASLHGKHIIPIFFKHLLLAASNHNNTVSKIMDSSIKTTEISNLTVNLPSPFTRLERLIAILPDFREELKNIQTRTANEQKLVHDLGIFLENTNKLQDILNEQTNAFSVTFGNFCKIMETLQKLGISGLGKGNLQSIDTFIKNNLANSESFSIDKMFAITQQNELVSLLSNIAKPKARTSKEAKTIAGNTIQEITDMNTRLDKFKEDFTGAISQISQSLNEFLQLEQPDNSENEDELVDLARRIKDDLDTVFTSETHIIYCVAKYQLQILVSLFIFGHFFPLPIFGKASPKQLNNIEDDLDSSDNATRLFSDLANTSSNPKSASELIQAFATECFPKSKN